MLETLRQRKFRFGFVFAMAAFFAGVALLFAVCGNSGNSLNHSLPGTSQSQTPVAYAATNEIPREAYQNQDTTYTRAFWSFTYQYTITGMSYVTQGANGEEKTTVDFASRPVMPVGVYEVTVEPQPGYVFFDGGDSKTFRLTVKPATIQWKFQGNIVNGYTNSSRTQMLQTVEFNRSLKYNPRDDIAATFAPQGTSGWTYSWNGTEQNVSKFYGWDLSKPIDSQELKNNSQGNPPNMWEAGDYKFTVCDPENYTNPDLILRIQPQTVNLASLDVMQWIPKGSGSGSTLRSGTIYVYQYKDPKLPQASYYYSANALSSAPNTEWQDWKFLESYTANLSIYAYREGITTHAIRLNRDQTSGLASEWVYYNAEYSGEYGGNGDLSADSERITQSGKYVAEAKLTFSRNYRFTYVRDPNSEIQNRGLSVNMLSDGSAIVQKTWYVVHYNNVFLDVSGKQTDDSTGTEIPYTIPSWTFGSYPSGGVNAPYLQHGDEWYKIGTTYLASSWADNYTLRIIGEPDAVVKYDAYEGGLVWTTDVEASPSALKLRDGQMDTVTFTLKRNGEIICENQMRSMWGYYFNQYMPAGEYEVIFNVLGLQISTAHNHWWDDMLSTNCGTEFPAFSQSFQFTVSPCPISVNDAAFNAYNNPDAKPFEVNFAHLKDGYQAFFGVISGEFPAVVTLSDVKAAATDSYWKTHAEAYFDEAPRLSFNLARMYNNTYYTADATEWRNLINGAGRYVVYYRSNMKNYLDPTENALLDQDARYKKYFEVVVYEVVELPVPVHTEFSYTGLQQALAVETVDSRYELTDNLATTVGTYTAKFTLKNNADYRVYRWNGWGQDEYLCPFEIVAASVTVPAFEARYYSGLQLYPELNVAVGPTGAPLYQMNLLNLPSGQVGYINAGSYDVELQLRDAANYCWVDARGEKIANVVNGKITVQFVINPAPNAWVDAIRLQGWEWGSFSNQNLPSASATSGAVRFTVTEDEAGLQPVAGLTAFTVSGVTVDESTENAFKALSAKTYYLWAEAVTNGNYATIEKAHCSFTVSKARNWWTQPPEINKWAEGVVPSAPTATARYGTAVLRVFDKDGNTCFYDSAQNINRLAEAKAGRYLLQYEVAGTENYSGIEFGSEEFSVYPAPDSGDTSSIWSLAPGIESWTEGQTPNLPYGSATDPSIDIVYIYCDSYGMRLASAPSQAGNYRLLAVAYRGGVEVARSEVAFEIRVKPDAMSGVDEKGNMNGAMIALICIVVIFGVVGLGLGGVLGYMYIKKKGIAMPWNRPKPTMPQISFNYGKSEDDVDNEDDYELPHGPDGPPDNDVDDEL